MPTLHLTSERNQRDFPWVPALLADCPEPTWPQIQAAVYSLEGDAGALYLAGGEPTLRRDLFVLVDMLAKTFPQRDLVLVTNGRSFCYERLCAALAAVRTERLAVEVWIASTRREVHDQVVGVVESFDQASRGIRQLLDHGQRTRVRVLIGRHNVAHLHEISACLGDRFPGIDGVVWDVATLAGPAGGDLWARPDEVSSYLESALNLLALRHIAATVVGMPVCTMSEKYRVHLDRTPIGALRDECDPCRARAECPGILAADAAFRVRPIVPTDASEGAVDYERYLIRLFTRYVPPAARTADSVLDAMCGQRVRNLSTLRRFFRTAATVHGTDIEISRRTEIPAGTSVFRADLFQPLRERYAFIALFKPPGDEPGRAPREWLATLVTALQPSGHLLIVLAEHTDVDYVLAVLSELDVSVLVSELNALRTNVEPEHKWVIVCRRAGTAPPSVGPVDPARRA